MSAFECNITPTRFRNEKKRNEDRLPVQLDLRPFSAKSIVSFEDVPVTKTARRSLVINNPFDEVLHVAVTKQPRPEFHVTLEWVVNKIAPNSQINLEIIWNPTAVVSCREILQISYENGNKDVAVILKSCQLKKTATKKPGPMNYPKKLKMKTPSPSKFSGSSFVTKPLVAASKSLPFKAVESVALPLSNLHNKFDLSLTLDQKDRFLSERKAAVDKENAGPTSPKNATALFDNIRFTPQTETKPKCESKLEYLSSLPTPVCTKRDDFVMTEVMSRRNLMAADISPVAESRSVCEDPRPQTCYIGKETDTFVKDDESSIVFEDHQSLIGNTPMIPAPLVVISEELETQIGPHDTFKINKSHSLVSLQKVHPLRASSESFNENFLKHQEVDAPKLCSQGSMPNLNEMSASVGLIEHNRYYHQLHVEPKGHNLSIESNADFHETEICAQSSFYNPDELASPGADCQASVSATNKSRRFLQTSMSLLPTSLRYEELRSPKHDTLYKMTFSPPTRNIKTKGKFDQSPEETRGRQIRATSWKHKQKQEFFAVPKIPRDLNLKPRSNLVSQSLNSLSCLSVSSAGSTRSTPIATTSGRLYNANHINAYKEKDPFSATTTLDPFLSSTMYLDEQTLDNIEKTYMKWLNALVTIPADLEADKHEKIDVGKLFNDVQSKELTLAPTKEAVCSSYYTARLDSLRAAAVKFFHSDAIATPLNKLTVIINEKNKLDVKAERSIHLDLVLQRNLLELLLCYNPLWLRIGLEVVFNVQLNLHSNQDIFGMSRFIITSMFKSQYLAEKYSKYSQQKEYLEKLRKFTVKNFLFVIFFLDRAKECRLIKQNPCLFVKSAPYKESNDILKKFASLVLANYGDILKMLRRFDYILTHKQTVIDEYNFAFKNLAVDLRDGVRLVKVMEIILLRDDLVQKVRVPAISRLQKVFNVDLALKALEAADYQILGNITSKDIADGHREKTLSLLWQIIYKFRAPRFNAAAIIIQKFWRSKYLMVVINRRIRKKEELRLSRAATVIQKHFRGWKSRQLIKAYRHRVVASCIAIQKIARGFIARRRYQKFRTTVIWTQRCYRRMLAVKDVRRKFQRQRECAGIIQKWWKRRSLASKLIASAIIIRSIKQEAFVRYESATVIQRVFKSFMVHKKLHEMVISIVQLNRKTHRDNLAAATLQSLVRMRKERKTFLHLKTSTIKIQQWWRHKREGKHQLETFKGMRQSTIKIQQWFRGILLMRQQRIIYSESLRYSKCVVKVQRKFRANLLMIKQRTQYQELKRAALTIQHRFKAMKMMKEQRATYQTLRITSILIQRRFRATLLMRVDRKGFLETARAVVVIQHKFRATILMRMERETFLKLRSSAVIAQQRYRAQLAMRAERLKYVELQAAVIKIQRWVRNHQEMLSVRNRFLLLKKTVLLCENRIIANRLMKKERENFLEFRRTVVTVQRTYRSKLETRKAHQQFKATQVMVVNLQTRIRGFLARQNFKVMQTPERLEIRKQHKAARTIQAAWRGYRERCKNCNQCFRGIVQRLMKAAKNVNPAQTLAGKLKTSINFLKEGYDSNIAISFLAKLEYMARTVPWILIDDAEFVSSFCYGLMAQAIRSEVDKQIIELCSCIILNLSRYKDTKENAFQEFGLLTIAQMLLRWCDKDCGIFNTLCTLIWVFAHCETKQKIIRDFILMKDGEFIIAQIKQNVLRKENMRRNARRPIGYQSISLTKYKKDHQLQLRFQQPHSSQYSSGFITAAMLQQCREMPSLQPDYGVVKTMPYIFYSSVFAFDNVLRVLGIRGP